MPTPTTQQRQPQKPTEPPPTPSGPVFDASDESDFGKRFRAALEKDDQARSADQSKQRGQKPAAIAPVEPPQKPPEQPAKPPAETTDVPAEPEPEKEPPKEPDKPPVVPELRRPKTADENLPQLRKRMEAAEARVKQLESEVKSKPKVDEDEVERLRKENQELHDRFAAVDLSMDPKFQAHYDGQITPAVEEAKTLVPPDQSERVSEIMRMPVGKERYRLLNEVYADLEPWQADRLREINAHIVRLEQEKSQWLGKAKVTRDQILTQQQQQQQAIVAQAEAAMSEAIQAAGNTETGLVGFVGDDKNKEQVAANVQLAKAIYTGQIPLQDRARAAIWAVTAPILVQELVQRDARIAELEETINGLKAATPKPGGGPSGEPAGDGQQEDPNLSYAERAKRRALQSGAFER